MALVCRAFSVVGPIILLRCQDSSVGIATRCRLDGPGIESRWGAWLSAFVQTGHGVGGQRHAPAALPPGKTRHPLHKRLGGPQGRSRQVRKITPPTGIRSPDRPARSQSLHRLRYPTHNLYICYCGADKDVGLWQLACWDCWFESRGGHGCRLWALCVVR
jgi:hypothetical protein